MSFEEQRPAGVPGFKESQKAESPKVTSYAELRRRKYGGIDLSLGDSSAPKVTRDPDSVTLPPRMFIDKQNYLSPRESEWRSAMKEPTWTLTEQLGCRVATPIGYTRGREFLEHIEEQEAQLQHLASHHLPASTQLIAVKRETAKESTTQRETRSIAALLRPNQCPVDIVPALDRYVPKAMAASMLPGYIESSKPFNRRIHHDVAGARMLTMPKLYRDGEDYMSTRVKMRSRR